LKVWGENTSPEVGKTGSPEENTNSELAIKLAKNYRRDAETQRKPLRLRVSAVKK